MPNIADYNAPSGLGLSPDNAGIEASVRSAYRVGAFYNQTAQALEGEGQALGGAIKTAGDTALQYIEHREISHGAAAFAELQDNLTQQWNETAKHADPNDPSVAGKFREETLEPALENYATSFDTEGGQKFAEAHIDALRQHMFTKTAADMSSLAKDAVTQNVQTTANKLTSTAYNDPSSLDHLFNTTDSLIGGIAGSSPNLTPDMAGSVKSELSLKVKEQTVRAAILGTIDKGGDYKSIMNDPRYSPYVNAPEIEQFAKAAKTQQRADQLQQKQLELTQRQLDETNVHKASNDIMANRVSIDPATGRPTIDPKFFSDALDIAKKYPNAPNAAETARTMINWGEAKQNEKAAAIQDDPTTKATLTDQLYNPDTPIAQTRIKIMQAEIDGKLAPRTAATMRELSGELENGPIKEPIFKDTMAGARSLIGGDGDQTQLGKYADFVQDFLPKYTQQKRAGTLPANALDMRDPKSLIRQSLDPYLQTLTLQNVIRNQALAPSKPAATPAPDAGPAPKVGDRKQFKQGWGVWNGTAYAPERPDVPTR